MENKQIIKDAKRVLDGICNAIDEDPNLDVTYGLGMINGVELILNIIDYKIVPTKVSPYYVYDNKYNIIHK